MTDETTFDDDGVPVPSVDFAYPDEPDATEPAQVLFEGVLRYICEPADLATVARRALLCGHLAGLPGLATQRELAVRLNVTPSAVSQALTRMRADLRQRRGD